MSKLQQELFSGTVPGLEKTLKNHKGWKKEALRLRITTNLSQRAIGRELGIPEATMRRFLKKALKGGCEGLDPVYSKDNMPKIGFFDLETSPIQGIVWGLWNQNLPIDRIMVDWKLLCFSYKWMGTDQVHCHSLHHYVDKKMQKESPLEFKLLSLIVDAMEDIGVVSGSSEQEKVVTKLFEKLSEFGLDKAIKESNLLGNVFFHMEEKVVKELWNFLDNADIVIAHNAQKFDVRKSQAKFLEYGLPPTSPFKVIDTLKISKSCFGLTSQKLQYITELLEKGSKLQTDMSLWLRCLAGDYSAYEYMSEYCDQDIVELENIYKVLAPWNKQMPNISLFNDKNEMQCNCCGGTNLEKYDDKYAYTNLSKFELYRCMDCGKTLRGRDNLLAKEKRSNLLMNVT